MQITTEYLRYVFDYKDGNLIWRINKGRSKIGDVAGSFDNKGYKQLKLNQVTYRLHRLIWIWHGKELTGDIDHIDRNKNNNKIENLRIVSASVNQWNTDRAEKGGVAFHKASNKWRARIKINNEEIYLGVYVNKEDADKARDQAARRRWGCR
jgi:hypothetical protein